MVSHVGVMRGVIQPLGRMEEQGWRGCMQPARLRQEIKVWLSDIRVDWFVNQQTLHEDVNKIIKQVR